MKTSYTGQKAIAEAAGMTHEQMMKTLETQKDQMKIAETLGIQYEANKKLTDEELAKAAAMGSEEAKKLMIQQQQASVQEKLAHMQEKFGELLVKIVEPLMPAFESIGDALTAMSPVISFIGKILGVVVKKSLDDISTLLSPIIGMFSAIGKMINGDFVGGFEEVGKSILKFLVQPIDMFINILNAAVGVINAFGANIGKITTVASKIGGGSNPEKHDDAIIGSDGGLIVSGQKGTYQLNQDDSVIAGTGLGSISSSSTPTSINNTNSDNSELVALLKQLVQKVDQPVYVNIGNKVIDELDTRTTLRKSYNTKVDHGYGVFG